MSQPAITFMNNIKKITTLPWRRGVNYIRRSCSISATTFCHLL